MGFMQQKRPSKPRPAAATPAAVAAAAPPPPSRIVPPTGTKPKAPSPPTTARKAAAAVVAAPPPRLPTAAKPEIAPRPAVAEATKRVPLTPAPQTDSIAAKTGTNKSTIESKPIADIDHALASGAVDIAKSTVTNTTENLSKATSASGKDRIADGEERITGPPTDKGAGGNSNRSADEDLGLQLSNLTLHEDDEVTKQFKELKIKEKRKENDIDDEHTEDSGLVARGGPERNVTKGSRARPYLLEQRYVSPDNHGGATVIYPSTAQQELGNIQNIPPQEIGTSYWQCYRRDTSNLRYNNCQNIIQDSFKNALLNEQQNILPDPCLPKTPLTEVDLKILEGVAIECLDYYDTCQANNMQQNDTVIQRFSQPSPDENSSDSFGFDIDEIIESDKYDESIQDVKQELSKEGIDKHPPPTTPDSAYDSDEATIGSPASSISVELPRETEKVQSVNPFSTVITQHKVLQQTGYPAASVSPIIHSVPPSMVFLVHQKPQPVMSPVTVQSLISPTTPPIPALVPRPILPGVSIPSPCNDPAIKRIPLVIKEAVKDKVWALVFAKSDSDFIKEDEDGNTVLGHMLSNRDKYKNFMEVFHVIIQRLKRIIQRDQDMARKILAAPNRSGHTPLDLACRYFQSGDEDALVVRYLADTMVEEGLDIGGEDASGNTLLHKICNYGDKAQFIMSELLSMKDRHGNSVFDVNRANHESKTPLHVAALKHSEQTPCTVLAQLLMRSGALASKQERLSGNTVFHCVASVSCDPSLLLTLLAITKDVETVVNTPNLKGDTPLHMVAANPTITLERQRLAVQHLIHYKAQPRLTNSSGRVPLSLVPADRKQDIKTVLYHK